MADEFDQFESYDATAGEERMKFGGLVSPGKHFARLNGASKTESKAKQTPGWELVFIITDGSFKDSEVKDTLFLTDNPRTKDRLALFGHRLGVLEKKADGSGYQRVAGKQDFRDVLDVECVIEVIHEPDQKDPNKKWPRLAFGGIWQLNHPDVKDLKKHGQGESGGTGGTASVPTNGTPTNPPAATGGSKKPKVDRAKL